MKTIVSLFLITGDIATAHVPASLTRATSCTATTSIPTCGVRTLGPWALQMSKKDQWLTGEPKVSCITSAASAVGCSATDYACPCHSSKAVFSSAEGCVVSACGSETASQLFSAASTLCAACS